MIKVGDILYLMSYGMILNTRSVCFTNVTIKTSKKLHKLFRQKFYSISLEVILMLIKNFYSEAMVPFKVHITFNLGTEGIEGNSNHAR